MENMQDEPRRRVETLFHAALTREAGPERQAYLDGACANDGDLRSRVEALVAANDAVGDELGDFLVSPAVEGSHEEPGRSIGSYKLLQQIGEGGMGVVYMAEQEKPVRRKVALKVIKLGMDTKQVIARFEAERQALAMMDHAHIARVLDAGATDSGRPYFVMELVRGVPINEYCDTNKLPPSERLGLFVAVCRAVQHAHQKGIIHRDLKPTNVLVTSHDGKPVPKIIDFGVAKATNQKLTERTLFTEFHQIIGTPEYMSPEQAEMSGLDVDTRSDIYALGVLLYELLTGTTPVDPKELRTVAYEEMTRMIREDEPPAPSTRISKLGADGTKIANNRGSDAGALSRHFRGDLDWIVMKALEKDRTRRYETASAFAEDVIRHLESRPVEAGPPGAGYRIAKFAHRNKKTVVAALVLAAVFALGLYGTTTGFLRARAEADRSSRMSASLQDVMAMTDPTRAADRSDVETVLATVRDVFGEDHATFAAVLDALAQRLHDAGDFEAAVELGRESLAVWKQTSGEGHSNVAIALAHLGKSLRAQGDDEQAEGALRAALAIFDDSDTPGHASHDARVALADLLGNRGDYVEADELLGEALAILRASPSPARFRILQTLEARALVQANQPSADVLETVRAIYDETHEFYPDDSPMLAMTALGYGRNLFLKGEGDAAEPYLREAMRRFRVHQDPPGFYFVVASDALFQIIRGREDEASVLDADVVLRDLIEIARSFWSTKDLVSNLKYYARRMADRGKYDEALVTALDAFQTLVDANEPADERDSLRGDLIELSVKISLDSDAPLEHYALARQAMELALLDEIDVAFVSVALGAALYRQGEYGRAAEILDAQQDSIGELRLRLRRQILPVVHAFRALSHAQLGDETVALEQLEALRAVMGDDDGGELGSAMLREAEALIEHSASSVEDD